MDQRIVTHIESLQSWGDKNIDKFFKKKFRGRITIEGDVLGRTIKINGEVLDFKKLHKILKLTPYSSYQWGCDSHISQLELAYAILYTMSVKFYRERIEVRSFVNVLDQVLLKHLPPNFKVSFVMGTLLKWGLVTPVTDESVKKAFEGNTNLEIVSNPHAMEMNYDDYIEKKKESSLGAPVVRV